MMTIHFTIKGKPISKARPRFKRYGKTYDPQEKEKERWQWEVLQQLPSMKLLITGPISLRVSFIMPIPKNTPKRDMKKIEDGKMMWHTKKPDTKNMLAWVEDCLNKFIWEDDSQVCYTVMMKVYGLEPQTEIEIKEI